MTFIIVFQIEVSYFIKFNCCSNQYTTHIDIVQKNCKNLTVKVSSKGQTEYFMRNIRCFIFSHDAVPQRYH